MNDIFIAQKNGFQKLEKLYLLLITFFGFNLRFYTIDKRSLWMDELGQTADYYFASSLYDLIHAAASHQFPPLDYIIGFYLLAPYFDVSEIVVRFPSLFFGSLTIVITFYLTRYIFSLEAAIIASLLVCTSKYLIEYSQEARPYSLLFFLFLLTIYNFFKALNEGRRKHWILFGITLFLLLMTRVVVPISLLISLNFLFVLLFLLKYFSWVDKKVATGRNLFNMFLVSSIVVAAYSPFLILVLKSSVEFAPAVLQFSFESIINVFKNYPFERIKTPFSIITSPLTFLFILFSVIGFTLSFQKEGKGTLPIFFCGSLLFIPLVQVFMLEEKKLGNYLRYFLYFLPPLYILTAEGIVNFIKKIVAIIKLERLYIPLLLLSCIPFLILSINQLGNYYSSDNKTNWRDVADYLTKTIGKEDVILTENFADFNKWDPGFMGRWPYFKKANKDYKLYDLTDEIISNPLSKGNIFLVFFDYPFDIKLEVTGKKLKIAKKTTNVTILTLKKPSPFLFENTLSIISELIEIMPPCSGLADLYLNRARIMLLVNDVERAKLDFESAISYIPENSRDIFSKKVKSIKPELPPFLMMKSRGVNDKKSISLAH